MTSDELEALDGESASEAQMSELLAHVGELHPDLHWVLTTYAICGAEMSMNEEQDPSGLGIDLQWMSPKTALEEARDYYPGIAATKAGFVPFGLCNSGSGDPYFIETSSGRVVRIPHEAANPDDDSLDLEALDVLAPNIREFLSALTLE